MGDRGQGGLKRTCLAAIAVGLLAPTSAVADRSDPVVLTGGDVPALNGVAPGEIVAFSFHRTKSHRHEKWTQVPVQVDQRKVVDFGLQPPSNGTPGVEGTVYGTPAIGQTALQYADPNTFVGPDADPNLDADDEIALMASDAGDRVRKHTVKPKSVWKGGTSRVMVTDPLGAPTRFIYLYRSKGSLDPSAGRDYVDYEFKLTSGDYRATYHRTAGPNPETSTISTPLYSAGFTDRWFFDQLAIKAGGASDVDILDGFKAQFAPTSCARSEATFNTGEGAFVANIDGPIRAIRAYVGANSGPLTERTNIFYSDREQIISDLRVHPIPGLLTYHDLSAAGIGMTYRDSTAPAGVPVDGAPDAVGSALPAWRLWSGSQGTLWSADRSEGSLAATLAGGSSPWYLDDSTPAPNLQCWGDAAAYGQAGIQLTAAIPNTDPRGTPVATLRETTTDIVAAPGMSAADAQALSDQLDSPLQTSIH
jgi:hypothetical protein